MRSMKQLIMVSFRANGICISLSTMITRPITIASVSTFETSTKVWIASSRRLVVLPLN